MKPPLPRIQTAVPRLPHVQLEIAKAIRTLLGADEDKLLRQRRAEIAAIRRDIEALTRDLPKAFAEASALAKAELGVALRKYSPDQPRVPAGNPDGGQWTTGGHGSELSADQADHSPRTSPLRPQAPGRYASLEVSPSNVLTDAPPLGTRYAAGAESDENADREEFFGATPGQLIRLEAAQRDLNALLARARRIDPNWSPQQRSLDVGVEGKILYLKAQAEEARAFLARTRDLGYARDLVTGRRIVWPPNTKTGDPLIDKTTDQLMDLLGKVMDEDGPRPDLNPMEYGKLIHKDVADELRAGAVPGLKPSDVERTFSLTGDNFYGAENSVRGDYVLTRDDGSVAAFYDFKTGRGMSELQVVRLRYMSNSGRAVPVIELNRERGAVLKHR